MENKGVVLRQMQKKDLPKVYEIEHRCFSMPWSMDALRGELKNDIAYYGVAEYDGNVIAYCGMWVIFDEAHITNVAVEPQFRRFGIGNAVMRHMMSVALRLSATRMTLEVRENNEPAKAMYAKLGFVQEGRRKGYYTDTGEDALILWNNLEKNLQILPNKE